MQKALLEAEKARLKDEVPVGAVIVHEGKIIARGHNIREGKQDPCGHAEMVAIKKAAKKIGSWRLCDTTLYVTLEPCPMCAGAIINARIPAVVFGAYDPKAGAFGTLFDMNIFGLNHVPTITGGILKRECAAILTNYFKAKRK